MTSPAPSPPPPPPPGPVGRVLVVTNDFGPRAGGIETYVGELLARLPPDRLVVHTADQPGAADHDAALPYPVVRDPDRLLLPRRPVAERVHRTALQHGARAAWFPSAAPLALLAPGLRRAGVERVVASSHGHEIWWGRAPVTRGALRRVARAVDVLTFDSATVRRAVASPLPERARRSMVLLSPGVDAARFHPGAAADPEAVRASSAALLGPWREAGGQLVLCASRLVPRKGHARLVRAWPAVRRRHPRAHLVLAGTGPAEATVRRAATAAGGPPAGVHVVGRLPASELPAWLATADLFVLPVADRFGGLVTESLGIVLLEAAAAGTPVVAGRAGGTVEAVLPGRTGELVDATDRAELAGAVSGLLADPERSRRWGEAGRQWVASAWSWQASAERLAGLLAGAPVERWP